MLSKRLFTLLLVLIAASLMLVACGGSGEDQIAVAHEQEMLRLSGECLDAVGSDLALAVSGEVPACRLYYAYKELESAQAAYTAEKNPQANAVATPQLTATPPVTATSQP